MYLLYFYINKPFVLCTCLVHWPIQSNLMNPSNSHHTPSPPVKISIISIMADIGKSLRSTDLWYQYTRKFQVVIFNLDISFAVLLLQDGDEYKLADPICTFVFSILVIITTVRVLRDTLHVVMEGKCIGFTCTLKLCQLLMSCHYSVLPSVALCVCNTMPMYGQ